MNKREFQHQFEISLLFPETAKGIDVGEGCAVRNKRGVYENPHIEAAYLGYAMARRSDRERLARFAPARHISPAMRTTLRAKLGYEVDDETIRAVLEVAGELPA
jgi:hypothetical protein